MTGDAVAGGSPPLASAIQVAFGHHRAGRLARAQILYREVLEVDPDNAQVLHLLGVALHQVGRHREAARHVERAISHTGDPSQLTNDLDEVYRALGRRADADSGLTVARLGLARCLGDAGDHGAAIDCLETLLRDAPYDAIAHIALGDAMHRAGRHEEAADRASSALAIDGSNPTAHRLLGHALFELGDLPAASQSFCAPSRITHAPDAPLETDNVWRMQVTHTKLRHDLDQLHALAHRRPALRERLAPAIEVHQEALRTMPATTPSSYLFPVPSDSALAPVYNRLLDDASPPSTARGALGRGLDRAAIEADFASRAPGFAWFDGFLCEEALAALQRYANESSIWLETRFQNEVGASLASGFACPLLLQIAAEVRAAFPSVFGALPLADVFAYKYYQDGTQGHVHADSGAASVNFWITPDTSNLDPAHGGLVIWNKLVPREYFRATPMDKDAEEQRLVAEHDAVATRVPYRCNRAMLFRSSVLHRSDAMRFRDEHDSRRVSITMIFGPPD